MKPELEEILQHIKKSVEENESDQSTRKLIQVAIDLVSRMPNDCDVERWKKDSITLSWDRWPDGMGH